MAIAKVIATTDLSARDFHQGVEELGKLTLNHAPLWATGNMSAIVTGSDGKIYILDVGGATAVNPVGAVSGWKSPSDIGSSSSFVVPTWTAANTSRIVVGSDGEVYIADAGTVLTTDPVSASGWATTGCDTIIPIWSLANTSPIVKGSDGEIYVAASGTVLTTDPTSTAGWNLAGNVPSSSLIPWTAANTERLVIGSDGEIYAADNGTVLTTDPTSTTGWSQLTPAITTPVCTPNGLMTFGVATNNQVTAAPTNAGGFIHVTGTTGKARHYVTTSAGVTTMPQELGAALINTPGLSNVSPSGEALSVYGDSLNTNYKPVFWNGTSYAPESGFGSYQGGLCFAFYAGGKFFAAVRSTSGYAIYERVNATTYTLIGPAPGLMTLFVENLGVLKNASNEPWLVGFAAGTGHYHYRWNGTTWVYSDDDSDTMDLNATRMEGVIVGADNYLLFEKPSQSKVDVYKHDGSLAVLNWNLMGSIPNPIGAGGNLVNHSGVLEVFVGATRHIWNGTSFVADASPKSAITPNDNLDIGYTADGKLYIASPTHSEIINCP